MRANRPKAGDSGLSHRRKVLHVTFGLDVGGQEKLLAELARLADRTRFLLRFVSLGSRGVVGDDIERLGWTVTPLELPSGLRPSLFVKLVHIIRRWRPDVVHTHDPRALFYAASAAALTRVSLLINTRHGKDFGATPRQLAIGRRLARLVHGYVCVSDDVMAQCLAEGIARERLITIKNGIDLDRFAFMGPRRDGPIVAVARLSPEKDIANLIRATAVAASLVPGLRVEVAGAGPCLEGLQRLAADLGVEGCIAFLGAVSDVSGVLARARALVLPSRSEGIPLTVLEAMASGLPVVATRVGGLPEVVADRLTGLLVPPADPAALAAAVVQMWNDPIACDGMGRAGRRRAEELFDVRRMVREYEALYDGRVAQPDDCALVCAGGALQRT
jgi:glycosyltransferase involved in cell wall biosynthesis